MSNSNTDGFPHEDYVPMRALRGDGPDDRAQDKTLKLILKRSIKSGLMGGKKFEVAARVDSGRDLIALFKGFPDELVLAYKSAFADRSTSLRRGEFLKGTRFTVGSLNEIIELEDRLLSAFDQLKRMIAIVDGANVDIDFEA